MSSILSAIGDVFSSVISMAGTVASSIAGVTTTGSGAEAVTSFNNPVLLLFCVAVPLCGIAVGMFKRLLSARG